MSLVGTRPILQDELLKYELHHRARIAIKPGITGMWQVSGRSDITDFEEVVRLDTEYISNWNFGLDVQGLSFPENDVENPIWIYWNKGIEQAPIIVQKAFIKTYVKEAGFRFSVAFRLQRSCIRCI